MVVDLKNLTEVINWNKQKRCASDVDDRHAHFIVIAVMKEVHGYSFQR